MSDSRAMAALVGGLSIILHLILRVAPSAVEVSVFTDTVYQKIDTKFLSHTLDTDILKNPNLWNQLNPLSPLLINLGRALSPAYLRFGGNQADFLFFRQLPSRTLPCSEHGEAVLMTDDDFEKLNSLCESWGWRLLFDLNLITSRDPETNQWDDRDAHELLEVAKQFKYKVDWQLGNEVNAKESCSGVNGSTCGQDFLELGSLLKNATQGGLVFGPDVSTNNHKETLFLSDALEAGISSMDYVTFHQYYGDSRTANASDCYDPLVLDRFPEVVSEVAEIVSDRRPIVASETGSFYGGGSENISDAFVASFMWLDKLGVSARMGIKMVMRQVLYSSSSYSLLDENLTPLPDYWLSVLYKSLVGSRVLRVANNISNAKFRIYAHCSKDERTGSVAVYALNLDEDKSTKFRVTSSDGGTFENSTILWYLLTPSGPEGIFSKEVKLNGVPLRMEGDQLPKMNPEVYPAGSVIHVPALSFGFAVFPGAQASVC